MLQEQRENAMGDRYTKVLSKDVYFSISCNRTALGQSGGSRFRLKHGRSRNAVRTARLVATPEGEIRHGSLPG